MLAQRNLKHVNEGEANANRQLSSGSRVYRAAADPSGMAITEKMRSKIVSRSQLTRNMNDGISLIQVAEGTLASMHKIGGRLRELAMQTATDTIGDSERKLANIEFRNLKDEMRRLRQSAKFNGNHIINESGSKYELQVGLNNNIAQDRLVYDIGKVLSAKDNFGMDSVNVNSKLSSQTALGKIDKMIQAVSKGRADLGSTEVRLNSMVTNNLISNENLSSSKSKIKDADIAKVTADRAIDSIKKNATTAMLTHTSQNPSKVLKLVG
jgi:flagellin